MRIDTLTYNNIQTQGAKRRLWLREHSPQHLQQCTDIMLRALQLRPRSASTGTIVLGAGACTEIPLAELARHSDEVVLADYDLASMQQGRDELASPALRKRVRLLQCDITGGVSVHLNRLAERQRWETLAKQSARAIFDAASDCLEQCEVPDPPEIEDAYPGEFGVVISSLVLSQLFSYPLLDVLDSIQRRIPAYLGEQERHRRYQEASQNFRMRVIQAHLHLLQTLLDVGGIVVLLSDMRGFVFKVSSAEHSTQPRQSLPIVPRSFPEMVREHFHIIEERRWDWIANLPEDEKLGRGYEVVGYILTKGIPFAQPPTGELRFRAPQPPEPWIGVREATAFSPMAPQAPEMGTSLVEAIGADRAVDQRPMGEDCLYLNIWSPGADQQKRPVMVYIHGGAFTLGSASDPWYDGTSFAANHNIVVVSLNYRLGIMGFVSFKDLAGAEATYTANCGLLDQIAALQWVRENIAAFGGDPDKVTVMGESAGAMSIAALLGMPAAQGLFQRAILESGAAGNLPGRSHATRVAQALLAKLGLEVSQLAGMVDVPLEILLKVQPELGREFGGVQAFSPIIDGDTLPLHPLAMIAQGSAANVTILVGTNRDEWRLFAMMSGGPKVDEELLKQIFGDEAKTVLATYREARPDMTPELARIDIMSDLVFRMPSIQLAEGQLQQGAQVWMYRFDWESPAFGGVLGAAHAMEIPFVWNTLDTPLSLLFTSDSPDRQPLADLMHAAWAAFIRSGNPAIASLPAWPPYDLNRRATMIFSDTPYVVDDPQGQVRPLWKHVFQGRERRA